MICDKAEGCASSCWHKEEHEAISECDFICPVIPAAICINLNTKEAMP